LVIFVSNYIPYYRLRLFRFVQVNYFDEFFSFMKKLSFFFYDFLKDNFCLARLDLPVRRVREQGRGRQLRSHVSQRGQPPPESETPLQKEHYLCKQKKTINS
jgi:hypothetical protein